MQDAETFPAGDVTVPASFEQVLEPGNWVIFERIDESSLSPIRVTTVEVADDAGAPIDVTPMDGTFIESTSVDGATYEGVVSFDISLGGTFVIDVSATDPATVRVGKSVTQNLPLFIFVIVATLGGGLLVVAGVVVAAIGSSRKSNARRVTAA